jgi:signal transduction histidine kinase/ligand-binding sensor domain-containing protein
MERIGEVVRVASASGLMDRVSVLLRAEHTAAASHRCGFFERCGLAGFLSIFLLYCTNLTAIDLHQPITQMHHTAWSAKEGVIGEVLAMAQTTDGFIWLGTTGGLLRFDGSVLERYKLEAGSFPKTWISALLATPDGGLWIGYLSGGASFLKRGGVTNYAGEDGMPTGRVRNFAQDGDGRVWAATVGGLGYFDGTRWRCAGKNCSPSGLPTHSPSSVAVDKLGDLWVADSNGGVFSLPRGSPDFQQVMAGAVPGYLPTFTQAGEDGMWLWAPDLVSMLRFPVRALAGNRAAANIANSAGMFLVDRDGSGWMMTRHDGVWRIPLAEKLRGRISPSDPSIEKFSEREGLTSATIYCVMEDREGDVWVGTLGGFDRFRARDVAWTELQSVPTKRMQLVAGDKGEVWASSPQGLWDARNGKPVRGSPTEIHFSFRDPHGGFWFWSEHGGSGAFWRWDGGQFRRVGVAGNHAAWTVPGDPLDDSWVSINGPVRALTRDDAGDLWVSIRGRGVFRQDGGVWRHIEILRGEPYITAYGAICDGQGRVWLAYPERREIGLWDHGTISVFSAETGLTIGPVTQIAYTDGQVWAGGESGLAIYSKGGFHTVEPAGGAEFGTVAGIVGGPECGLWLSTAAEILHVPQKEVALVLQDWRHKVQYESLDLTSDLVERPSGTSDTPAVMGTDGILWFATPRGVFRVDPAHLNRNLTPPQVAIRNATANGKSYSVNVPVMLPAHTTSLHIGYSVLSFPLPEKARSRYRLLGSDEEWQDGGSRVDAPFNKLGPGRYTFQVVACNNDGIWNEAGASLNFTIQPAFYQTIWVRLFYALVGVALLWAIYRLRLRQIAATMGARFDERLAERVRIARDFHDTLLQTLQGSKMVADDALAEDADPAQLRRAMVLLAGWLGQAIQEGREALSSLRSSTTEDNDLSAALRRAGDESRSLRPIEFDLSVEGSSKQMHPIARDEVYRIGYEAIRNACNHSGATHLGVKISYLQDLVLQVQDNGKGFESSAVNSQTGRGHFGLVGMYERAARIRGKLTISSSPGGGTRVELIVPHSVVFPGRKPGGKLPKSKLPWQ